MTGNRGRKQELSKESAQSKHLRDDVAQNHTNCVCACSFETNIVKHFSWVPDEQGKRSIHKKPRYSEIQACRPWLDAEIAVTRPEVIICLGATAAQALLGKEFSVMRQRGKFVASDLARYVMATVHPSSILRAQDDDSRRQQKEALIADLRAAAAQIRRLQKAA